MRKQTNIVLALLLYGVLMMSLIGCMQKSVKNNCSILRQGTFKYLDFKDTTAFFTINEDKHHEYAEGGKCHIESKIKWLNECQYEATLLSCNVSDFPFKPGTKLVTTIDKVEDNVIFYTSLVNGLKTEGRLIKVGQ